MSEGAGAGMSELYDGLRKRYDKGWGEPLPERPEKRFLVRVSYEDASDVSDYFMWADTLEEAEREYRAYYVWDLEAEKTYEVDWIQKARQV